jgi:hypothetical protein
MALVLKDRVKENTNTVGTGAVTLTGTFPGYQAFSVIGNANTTYYAIVSQVANEWEVGIGTYTLVGTSLSRDTVLASSNSGSLVSFTAGSKDVFVTYPAGRSVYADGADIIANNAAIAPVASGGTGLATLTANYIPYGNGTSPYQSTANLSYNGTVLRVGAAALLAGTTNPVIAGTGNANSYVQNYVYNANAGTSASADFVVYANNSTDAAGFGDFGHNSSTFNDAAYSVTGPNETYLFASALNATFTGNLVYATSSTGSANAHQWYVGGFNQAKGAYKMQLSATTLTTAVAIAAGSNAISGGAITSASGNITATTGNIVAATGDLVATAGNITATAGNITATLGNITATAGNLVATAGDVVANSITPVAGIATVAPIVLTSGTNLTTAAAGAIEYDGVNMYGTVDTSSGRSSIGLYNQFKLTADGSNINTIANFFGGTSNIALVAQGYYDIEIIMYFRKNTAGTVTWTLTNSAAPTEQNIHFEMSPVTGIVAPPGTATMLVGQAINATAAYAFTTASLTTGVDHYARFRIQLDNGTGTSLKIQATAGAGTITPLVGSIWTARRLNTTNNGTYAA